MEFIWDAADAENLYQHVLKTEGEKHPIYSPERMEECADYILSELRSYGLETDVHDFTIDGLDYTFRNVEATAGDDGAELLIVSHYDTVRHSPGANDNGSAIAVMLESARILAQANLRGKVRFVSFNLEEGNPAFSKLYDEDKRLLGLNDEQGRFLTWHTSSVLKRWRGIYHKYAFSGLGFREAMLRATEEIERNLTKNELALLKGEQERMKDVDQMNWCGRTAMMGSSAWVEKAVTEKKEIRGVLCLETMGYISEEPNSQKFPQQVDPMMFEIHGTQDDLTVGDFLTIVGDVNSKGLADTFCEQSRHESIDLPYACLKADLTYEQAAMVMPDILRSDHACFWREGIPALLMTDTADFRYPYYHTHADTIDKLDFDFLRKVCKATIATAVKYCS